MELGDIIKKLREGKGLTQVELAEKTGIPPNTIHRFENDYKDKIPPARLEIISKALNTTVSSIYSYKENPSMLNDPAQFLESLNSKPKVSVMVELDGTVDNLNIWFATLKKLNAAL